MTSAGAGSPIVRNSPPNPHYVRTACCDHGYGRPSLRAIGSVSRNDVGAASLSTASPRRARDKRDPELRRTGSRDPMARGREVCSAKAPRRGVVAPLIMESEVGPFGRGGGGQPGGPSCRRRKVHAPNARAAADQPCPDAAPFCAAGGTTIPTILRRPLLHNAG